MAALTKSILGALKRLRSSSELGAEVVEMAIVTPLLLLVIMGVVDFGFLFQRYAVLTNAAMEGARVGTLPGYQIPADVEARVQAYAASGGINPATITVEAIPATVPAPNGGTYPAVQVTVQHDYTLDYIGPIAAIFGGNGSRTVTMRARSLMRLQAGAANPAG
jgi:Flp pilus assembly protein TadG